MKLFIIIVTAILAALSIWNYPGWTFAVIGLAVVMLVVLFIAFTPRRNK
jgi:hypothetical protein